MTKDDPAIDKRRKERLEKQAAQNAKGMTVADRLTRRAKQQITKVTLSDDLGEFIIELRQPTRKELDELLKFQREIQDPNKTEEASKELYGMLGKLCCDKSLDEQYWREGEYSLSDLMELINKLFEGFIERFKEVQSFRPVGHGAGSVPDVRIPGKAPA